MLTTLFYIILAIGGLVALFFLTAMVGGGSNPEKLHERERRQAEWDKLLASIKEWRENAFNGYRHETEGYLLTQNGELSSVFALNDTSETLRVAAYSTKGRQFQLVQDESLRISDILSVGIVRPNKRKKVKRTQAVPVVTTKKKSPIARGIAGGVLLGPAGLVLGAASGIGKDVKTKVEERTVWDEVEAEGDPELHIGTNNPDFPLIKLRPHSSSVADEWLHRITALQARAAD